MILRTPGRAGADLPLENQSGKNRRGVAGKKRKYKNIKEKVTRMGEGKKAAKPGTAQASCARPQKDSGWAYSCWLLGRLKPALFSAPQPDQLFEGFNLASLVSFPDLRHVDACRGVPKQASQP